MIQESILQIIICCTHFACPELECGIPAFLTFNGTGALSSPQCKSPLPLRAHYQQIDWHSSVY